MYDEEPDLVREGGSIPVTLTLEEVTGKNVILLPIGACNDAAHSQNEKMDRCNYIRGVCSVPFTGFLVVFSDLGYTQGSAHQGINLVGEFC